MGRSGKSRGSALGHFILIAVTCLVWGCEAPPDPAVPGQSTPTEKEGAGIDGGKPALATAVDQLRKALGSALKAGLAQGPSEAIDACRLEAPRLAEMFTADGIRVGRTSHRLRNPMNAPEAWMAPLLAAYRELEPARGEPRTITLDSGGTAYVEPIYLQPLCLTCHGEHVAPVLIEKIREHYPEDEAVGFKLGELRGMFWAVRD